MSTNRSRFPSLVVAAFAAALVLGLATTSPAAAQADAVCTTIGGKIEAFRSTPATWFGKVTGSLSGSVGFQVLREAPGDKGTVVRVLDLQYAETAGSLRSVLTATDTPLSAASSLVAPKVRYWTRFADGEIGEGSGRFAGAKGKLHIEGKIDDETGYFVAKYTGQICVPGTKADEGQR